VATLSDRTRPAIRLTVIVPVLDDEAALSRLLDYLAAQPSAGADRIDEIVVVDGGASDRLRAICRTHDAEYLRTPPGRGRQLNAGAARASGEVLWFLHADATPSRGAPAEIRTRIAAGAEGGYCRFCFAGVGHAAARLLATLINFRARHGIAYGDQGLFFAAGAFAREGGFADQPLFEEVALVRAFRRRGRFVALDADIGVSPRRWEASGWLRRTLINRALAIGYAAGIDPERLANWYRRSSRA
jgi:rSAM/selenodomain-associated transferase 2